MKLTVKKGMKIREFNNIGAYNIAKGTLIIGKEDTSTIIPLAKIDEIVITGIPPQVPPEPVPEKDYMMKL